jgi:uncharacterized lipoprotein YmbA
MRRPRACWPIALGALLCACSARAPLRFYTLEAVAAPSRVAGSGATPEVPVRLQSVRVPAALDRPELVTRHGPYRVLVSEQERWAGPLEEQIRRALSEDLAARLPEHLLADPYEPATDAARRLLSVSIIEFLADESCAVSLSARWTLRGPDDRSRSGSESVTQPGRNPCAGAVPAAMSAALGALADQLAMRIEERSHGH